MNKESLRCLYDECDGCRLAIPMNKYNKHQTSKFCINLDYASAGYFEILRSP